MQIIMNYLCDHLSPPRPCPKHKYLAISSRRDKNLHVLSLFPHLYTSFGQQMFVEHFLCAGSSSPKAHSQLFRYTHAGAVNGEEDRLCSQAHYISMSVTYLCPCYSHSLGFLSLCPVPVLFWREKIRTHEQGKLSVSFPKWKSQ